MKSNDKCQNSGCNYHKKVYCITDEQSLCIECAALYHSHCHTCYIRQPKESEVILDIIKNLLMQAEFHSDLFWHQKGKNDAKAELCRFINEQEELSKLLSKVNKEENYGQLNTPKQQIYDFKKTVEDSYLIHKFLLEDKYAKIRS